MSRGMLCSSYVGKLMKIIISWIGIFFAWVDALTALFQNIFLPYTKGSAKNALLIYTGTMWPYGIKFKDKAMSINDGWIIMNEKRCFLERKLKDREYLKSLPENTVGKLYYNFIEQNLMYAEKDFDYHNVKKAFFASSRERFKRRLIKAAYYNRVRSRSTIRFLQQLGVQHDLFHAMLGYGANFDGEIGVHGFLWHHMKIPAVKLIFIFGLIAECIRSRNLRAYRLGMEAYRNGKQANTNLFCVDWLKYLETDVNEVFAKFNIKDNLQYKEIYAKSN